MHVCMNVCMYTRICVHVYIHMNDCRNDGALIVNRLAKMHGLQCKYVGVKVCKYVSMYECMCVGMYVSVTIFMCK